MPTWGREPDYRRVQELSVMARNQVRAKFPQLLEGSAGWQRAIANRIARLKRTH